MYNWNVGNGWYYEGSPVSNFTTTTNSIELVPYVYPPGDVSVVPELDNTSYPELIADVSLSSYSPYLQITGSTSLCDTSSYTINNLPSGTSVYSWSSSDTNIATISYNSNQATLTATGNGIVTLTAVVLNSCGQTANITLENVYVGNPTVTDHAIYGGHDNVSVSSSSQLHVSWVTGDNIQYYWFITTINSSCGPGEVTPKFQTANGSSSTLTSSYNYASVLWGGCTGTFVVNCRIINDCGSSDVSYKVVNVYDPNGDDDPCDDIPFELKASPNPSKGKKIDIVLKPAPGTPCNTPIELEKGNKFKTFYSVRILDFKGVEMYSERFETEKIILNNLNLKQGIYILSITSSNGVSQQKRLIVK